MMRAAFVFGAMCAAALSMQAATPQEQAVEDAVSRLVHAQAAFDLPGIQSSADASYFEISPLGEIDDHDRMLSYYAPDKKVEAPPLDLHVDRVEANGIGGIEIATVTWSLPSGPMRLRAVFTARHEGAAWKVVSAQYTPIRMKK